MAVANLRLGEHLTEMMNKMGCSGNCGQAALPNADMTFMTMLWPLLPLLPPESPLPVVELLEGSEACDVCGTGHEQAGPGTTQVTGERGSSLDRMMDEVQQKMEDTLNSIERTTVTNMQLAERARDIIKSGKFSYTDAEVLSQLKSLLEEKAKRERKVRSLELQEQEMRESLMTAINWAKSIEKKRGENRNVDDVTQ
ncbi:uncharacterized protein LOC124352658 [Homalodisca vitripennis]|uniref:uncharacterized protein LOC124352658 n=1 Tax=Homalodisca vitripennis TaxID=197043 RepID=UPI001EEC05B5|nr:uncharacterized protein LOC124352658 [Homalodisca vitripennis]KAG8327694.1 hypothetical protein J6590_015726 [Homalodisca vitripennis]